MKKKWYVYTVLLILVAIANIYYYREIFLQYWMRYNLSGEYIVVSLSTTPNRINEIAPTLESLYKQNVKINAIFLNVPHIFKRTNTEYKIPEFLLNDKRIKILRTDDYGPGTKLLGVLEQVDLPQDAIIIVLDDDSIYPKNLILHLAYKSKVNPNAAYGLSGSIPDYDKPWHIREDSDLGFVRIKRSDAFVSFLHGYAGIVFRRNFFKDDIFALKDAPKDCYNSDDIYLSFYLAKNNIPRRVLKTRYISSCNINWETKIGLDSEALHNLIPKPTDKTRNCIAYLHAQYPDVVF